MGTINNVTIIGRLVKNAELKVTEGGMSIVNATIAVSENVREKNGEYTTRSNFFDVTMFGNYAKSCLQSLRKGQEIAISGRLRQDRWEKNGQSFQKVGIITDDFAILREPKGKAQEEQEVIEVSEVTNVDPTFFPM